jgi:Zn-finger nucleic acid-binding protein
LNVYSLSHLKFIGCPKCKGLWLVRDELRKLKNLVGTGALHWLNDEVDNIEKTSAIATGRPCVNCHTTMVSVIFGHSSVVIDWCPQCQGVWLDGGAFAAISDYLSREALGQRPADIKKRLVEDAKRVVKGGPEGRAPELADAGADLAALRNATIFEHPALEQFLSRIPRVI